MDDTPIQPDERHDRPTQPAGASGRDPIIYDSAELLQGRREAWIEHDGQMYRLRLTSSGKLYLTK